MKKNYFIQRVLLLVSVLFAALFLSIDWDSLTWQWMISLFVIAIILYVVDSKIFAGITEEEMEKICFLPRGFLKEEED